MIALFIFGAWNFNRLCCLVLGIHPDVIPHGIHPDAILYFGTLRDGILPPGNQLFHVHPFRNQPFHVLHPFRNQPFGIHWGFTGGSLGVYWGVTGGFI